MEIRQIEVPHYVNYISEWNELDMTLLSGHIIMDKTITGCGFTEYFLTNSQNVILCSPRKVLLENKSDQHKGIVFYVKNELEKSLTVDMDLDFKGSATKEDLQEVESIQNSDEQTVDLEKEQQRKNYIIQLRENISQYIDRCYYENRPFKILVTYDSLKHVLEVLRSKFPPQIFNTFQFVVDEFQSIFTDSKFKGNVELDFIEYLQSCCNVCYLSATPMIKKYLEQINEFKDLPYYKFIWGDDKVVKAKIIRKRVSSIFEEAGKIIEQYRNGIYPRKILEDKSIHESKEVVFYVNSVKTICGIIRRFGLTPSETNIICSRDNKNRKKLRQVKHDFGNIPLQNQPHKMFTFCTRTVYLGADFYSHSAYTVVFSDCNIETLAVDISLDLPQILGRQRLKSNVFRNECLLFYKIQRDPITKEKFDKHIEKKRKQTNIFLGSFDKSTIEEKDVLLVMVKVGLFFKYKIDYIGIRSATDTPTFNKLVELSEERAWEVSQLDYQDNITVRKVLEEDYIVCESKNQTVLDDNSLLCSFMFDFNDAYRWADKMKVYCDFLDQHYNILRTNDIYGVPREFQNYVNLLGTKRVKALKYQKSDLENEYKIIISQDKAKESILSLFQIGSKLLLRDIKEQLQRLYDSLSIKKVAKASDLENYFELKDIRIKMEDGRQSKGYELLKIKY